MCVRVCVRVCVRACMLALHSVTLYCAQEAMERAKNVCLSLLGMNAVYGACTRE